MLAAGVRGPTSACPVGSLAGDVPVSNPATCTKGKLLNTTIPQLFNIKHIICAGVLLHESTNLKYHRCTQAML